MAVDDLIIDRFLEQIQKEIDLEDQLGNMDKAFMLSKCARVISVLTHRLNEYQTPIPVELIHSIFVERR